MTKLCICQICNCGRHHCPHQANRPAGDFGECMITSYNTAYKKHPINPRENFKPDQGAFQSGEPLSDQTTFRTDYIKHPVERPFAHQPEQYKKPPGNMDVLTSYHRDYTKKNAPPAQMVKQEQYRQMPTRFEGEPTYKVDYKKWPLEKLKPKQADAYIPPNLPFEGQSTFQRDFQRYNELPRQSMRPSEAAHMSDAPFDGNTGYRDDYIKHPLQGKEQRAKEKYHGPSAPFDGISTFQRDYTKKQGNKADSCKPDAQAYQSSAPLDDLTTFKNDFRRWQGERPFVHQPEIYKKPEGETDFNTTNRVNFKQHPLQKIGLVKPDDGRIMFPGKFEGDTNYRNDFKKWGFHREAPKPRESWCPNMIPFEGQATYKTHFVPHVVNPAKSMRPDISALASNAPFEDATMYRTEFIKKQASICPAAILNSKSSNYSYVETDARGHKQYRSVFEETTPLGRAGSACVPKVPIDMVA